jgi:CHRD domain
MLVRLAILAAVALLPVSARATLFFFVIPLNGANEVLADGTPNQGDPDGVGLATLIIDDAVSPPSIAWQIDVQNIDLPPTGAHIHQGAKTTTGPILIDFSGQLSGQGLQDADLAGVLADPTGWYVNVHNDPFRSGAIRGQIPEPGTALLLCGGLSLLARRPIRRNVRT